MEETIKTDSKTEEVSGWLAFFYAGCKSFCCVRFLIKM